MRAALLAGLVLLAYGAPGWSRECHVDTTRANHVTFVSDAPIEDFEGTTDRIDGYVYWEGDALIAGDTYAQSEFYFEVLLDALDTGIGLRNRHMRDNYLHTRDHPYATFDGTIQRVDSLTDSTWRIQAHGTLSIHGVDRPYDIECTVTPEGSGFRLHSAFEVRLPDFDIEVPSLMFMKISEVIQIELHVYMVTIR
jgi:polyisoprenoid-binding protein YceI